VKRYFSKILIGSFIILLSAFIAWQILANNSSEIKIISISVISDINIINNAYQVEIGDEVEIEIVVQNKTNLSIKYIEINDQKYYEKDINYDLSYMEPNVIDDGTRKLTITYTIQEDDEYIQLGEVRLYIRGLIYVGQKLDIKDINRFDLHID